MPASSPKKSKKSAPLSETYSDVATVSHCSSKFIFMKNKRTNNNIQRVQFSFGLRREEHSSRAGEQDCVTSGDLCIVKFLRLRVQRRCIAFNVNQQREGMILIAGTPLAPSSALLLFIKTGSDIPVVGSNLIVSNVKLKCYEASSSMSILFHSPTSFSPFYLILVAFGKLFFIFADDGCR